MVEYTELTPEQARARDAGGQLRYRWASPALHVWSVEFLARLVEPGFVPAAPPQDQAAARVGRRRGAGRWTAGSTSASSST